MSGLWEQAAHAFPVEKLDPFLSWAAERGASDVSFQTGSPAYVEVDGVLERATGVVFDSVAMGRLVAYVYDTTGEGILRAGRAIDCSHAVVLERNSFIRFRCNFLARAGGERIWRQSDDAGAAWGSADDGNARD